MTHEVPKHEVLEVPRRHRFEEWVAALAMFLMLALVCAEIVMRDVFNTSTLWSEEVARYLMIWSVYFGSAAAVASADHLRIEMLINYMPRRVRNVLDLLAEVWLLAFCLAITWAGYQYVRNSFALNFYSADSNLAIEIGWIQLVIPITFALSSWHAVLQIVRIAARLRGSRRKS
jgi:C4-dicarboxylate transporter DctQ subunit